MRCPNSAVEVAFIAFVGSGVHAQAFPIEVGWAFANGPGGSRLIRPAAGWRTDLWDAAAEARHGVSFEMLQRDGVLAEEVAAQLARVLGAFDHGLVCSQSPDRDAAWLRRLAPALGAIALTDLSSLKRRLLGEIAEPIQLSLPNHRAGPEAERLAAIWRAQLALVRSPGPSGPSFNGPRGRS